MSTSTKRRLADALLGGRLDEFVTTRLDSGKSWRQVSIDLRAEIDVDVHEETLKRWYKPDGSGPQAVVDRVGAA